MSKDEALVALKQGKKITHVFFTSDEWMMQRLDGRYEFEDGNICDPTDFWTYRRHESWNKNWNLFLDKQ